MDIMADTDIADAAITAVGMVMDMATAMERKMMKRQKTQKAIPEKHKKGFYESWIKRPQDFVCASMALIVLSPVMVATALLVRKNLGSPVIFTQERPGLNGKIFKLYAKYLPKELGVKFKRPKRPDESVIYGAYIYAKQRAN